jgi:hypothetical protein
MGQLSLIQLSGIVGPNVSAKRYTLHLILKVVVRLLQQTPDTINQQRLMFFTDQQIQIAIVIVVAPVQMNRMDFFEIAFNLQPAKSPR